jgi:hypothetical protein
MAGKNRERFLELVKLREIIRDLKVLRTKPITLYMIIKEKQEKDNPVLIAFILQFRGLNLISIHV